MFFGTVLLSSSSSPRPLCDLTPWAGSHPHASPHPPPSLLPAVEAVNGLTLAGQVPLARPWCGPTPDLPPLYHPQSDPLHRPPLLFVLHCPQSPLETRALHACGSALRRNSALPSAFSSPHCTLWLAGCRGDRSWTPAACARAPPFTAHHLCCAHSSNSFHEIKLLLAVKAQRSFPCLPPVSPCPSPASSVIQGSSPPPGFGSP